ncbi:MAG: class I SAM-dependent methyltransferase, partial [Dehalococcoidia bacterium]
MTTPISHRDSLDRIAGFWSERADGYNERPPDALEAERAAWLPAIRDLLPVPPRDVLDVGTGPGDLAWLCAALGHRSTGIDRAEGMLRIAQAIAPSPPPALPPTFLSGDAHAPPFPPDRFDVVASRFLLWTLLDPAAALAGWLALLRPGGRIVAFECLWWVDEMRDPRTGALPFDHSAMVTRYREMAGAPLPITTLRSLAEIEVFARAAGFEEVAAIRLEGLERSLWPVMDARGEGRYP